MVDRYVKSDETKKILSMDATNFYGHFMIQPLPFDEIEMWHGQLDLYLIKLDEILYSFDDSDIGYLVEVDLNVLIIYKRKQKTSHLLLKTKLFININIILI